MQLLSQDSQFAFSLPSSFFPEEIEEMFAPFIESKRIVYPTIADYLNAQIRSVNIPGYSYSPEEQTIAYGKPQGRQPAAPDQSLLNRTMNINFKDVDSNQAYFIAQRIWLYLYENNNVSNQYLGPIYLYALDQQGDAVFRVNFRQCLLTGISDKQYNFASQQVSDKSFSWNVYYNWTETEFLLKRRSEINKELLLEETFPVPEQ